jgi:2-keto-4-pentenoate hydratase/2-oxohepta-3-ene-1,7-dioic acid hydratase in catechol pathway
MSLNRASFLTTAAAGAAVTAAGAAPAAAAAAPLHHIDAVPASPAEVAAATRGMTLTTLRDAGRDHLGIRTPRGVVDVAAAAAAMNLNGVPNTVDDVVNGYGNLGALANIAANAPAATVRAENAVEYGPLVGKPRKILCVGLNYAAHLAEAHEKPSGHPDMFAKWNNTLNRHNGTVSVSTIPAKNFDYESELVMVMGKVARNVSEADALSYVYGYACGHDFSARDLQMQSTQWTLGKTPDQFGPLGPWLVTADQIPDPQTLQVQTYINDEPTPRQDMNTSQMIFSCKYIVSYLSTIITLEPGDVIFTGTPSGVILGYPPEKRVWLKPGDRVRTVISKLGELHFTLV